MILSPNDVVLISENSLYFTNDHKYYNDEVHFS